MSTKQKCGCKPGTAENGWHETRDPHCVATERASWTHLISWFYKQKRAGVPTDEVWTKYYGGVA